MKVKISNILRAFLSIAIIFSTPNITAKPTDPAITSIISKIKDGKLPTSALGPLADILNKLGSTLTTQIVDISDVGQHPLPIEFNPFQATSFRGKITFLKQPVTCTIIIGKLKDAKLGFSLALSMDKNYTINDLNFLKPFGVTQTQLGQFGTIQMPKPSIIFSTFPSYTNADTKTAVKAGITVGTKTRIAPLMKMIRTEANQLTGGQASKLPFLSKVNDNSEVAFNVAVGFTGTKFESVSANISLPLEMGINIAQLRAQEKNFHPNIKAPFAGLNQPIKEVTGIINKPPFSDLKDITVGNFVASFGYGNKKLKLSFGGELNITTNSGARYGMMTTIMLTPDDIGIELKKSPSITSIPLGNGVSLNNVALAAFIAFKGGVPGLGILGEIEFPSGGEKLTIGMGGLAKVGTFMMTGSVKNLDARKMAEFNANIIKSLAHLVKFDTSKLDLAMKQLPPLKIHEAMFYFASNSVTLGGRIFPKGVGVTLDVEIDKQKAKLSVAGSETELSFMGYLSAIKSPAVVISGMGPDKKHGTADDGPIIDFIISANQPLKTNFDMSGNIAFPPVNIKGDGDISLGIGRIAADFSSQVGDLFKAKFNVKFDVQKILDAHIGFALDAKERKGFLALAFRQLEKAIKKAQTGAAKPLLEPLRLLAKKIGEGVDKLKVGLPSKIAASLTASSWGGSLEIDGGSFELPVIGEIKLGIPKIDFSLKDPMKAIGKIAEKWANKIVDDMKKLGDKIKEFGEEIGKGLETAAQETGEFFQEAGEETGEFFTHTAPEFFTETGQKAKKEGEKIVKGLESVGRTIASWFGTKKIRRIKRHYKPKSAYKAPPRASDDEIKKAYTKQRTSLMKRINELKSRIKAAQRQPSKNLLEIIGVQYNQIGQALPKYNGFVANSPLREKYKDFPNPINPEDVGNIPAMWDKLEQLAANLGKEKGDVLPPVKELRNDLIARQKKITQTVDKFIKDTASAIKQLKTADASKTEALYKQIVQQAYPEANKYKQFNKDLQKAVNAYGFKISNVILPFKPDKWAEISHPPGSPRWTEHATPIPLIDEHLDRFKKNYWSARRRNGYRVPEDHTGLAQKGKEKMKEITQKDIQKAKAAKASKI